MKCEKCGSGDLSVISSGTNSRHEYRFLKDGYFYRQRVCSDCLHKFYTVEMAVNKDQLERPDRIKIKTDQLVLELDDGLEKAQRNIDKLRKRIKTLFGR